MPNWRPRTRGKTVLMVLVAICGVIVGRGSFAAPPPLGYQGELLVDDVAFQGAARFKFTLLRSGASLWSNDGTSTGGSEPSGSVTLAVEDGLFSVLLGGTGMAPLPEDLGSGAEELLLRLWVDTGEGFELLSDQIVGGSAFAFASGSADRAGGDFDVPGALRVDGPVSAGGGAGFAGDVTAGGELVGHGIRLLSGALVFPDGTQLTTAPSGGSGGGGIEALTNQDGAIAITNPTGPQAVVNLAPNGVTGANVVDGSLTGADLSDGSVTGADLSANAAVAESKLALDFPTHSNLHDPTAGEKAALAGTDGTPGAGNRFVTEADPRLADPRIPTGAAGGALTGAFPNPGLADDTVVRSVNGLRDDVVLAAGANILLGQNGDTLTVAAVNTEGVPSVNGITGPVTLVGAGGTVINTEENAITITSVGGGGTGVQGIQNPDNALTVTNPTGPTVTLNVKPLGINGTHLAPNSITTDKLVDGAVTGADLADATIRNADVAVDAAIAESKLALQFPTHPNVNDPTAAEKAALAGTNGVPGGVNRFVTASDSRLADARTPAGNAGGDLGGTYPNPAVDGLQGRPVSANTPSIGEYLQWTGENWAPMAVPGQIWSKSGTAVSYTGGSVGIGIDVGRSRLHLHNPDPAVGSPNFLQVTNAGSGTASSQGLHVGVFTTAEGTYGGVMYKGPFLLRLGTANSYHLNLNEFGRLGLGTVSPQGKLDIVYNSSGTSPQLMISEDEPGYGRISFRSIGVSDKYWTTAVRSQADDGASQYNVYYFNGSTGSNVMSMNGSGRVGIGTDIPEATLHVDGDLRYAPVTGYHTVNPHDLTPSVSGFAFTVDTFGGLFKNDATAQEWRAPIHLPHGATIVSVRLVYKDSNSAANIETRINRLGIGTGNVGTLENVAEFTPTGSGSGYRTLTQNTILKPAVDNQNWRYQFWLRYPTGIYSYSSISFVACVITYTTDRPY